MTELKAQVNRLEAEVEEQRAHKQVAMVENEQLRMEVEGLRSASVAGVGAQIGLKEADSECKGFCPGGLRAFACHLHCRFSSAARAQAAELRFSQLKERHAELITSHADLMKKVTSRFLAREENAKKCLTVNCAERRHGEAPVGDQAGAGRLAESQAPGGEGAGTSPAGEEEHGEMAAGTGSAFSPCASVPEVSLAVRLLSHQVNQQQQEAQQLTQDLLQQKAEVTALRSSLETKERVRLLHLHTNFPTGSLLMISA